MKRCSVASGFTLVEMLVVIGLIATLVALLLPSLNKARQAAQCVQCASNLRQLGMAFHMYAQESQGYLPQAVPQPGLPTLSRWDYVLKPELGLRPDGPFSGVFMCPTHAQQAPAAEHLRNYGMNARVGTGDGSSGVQRLSGARHPARTALVMPAPYRPALGYFYSAVYPTGDTRPPPVHQGNTLNVLFFDAHVSLLNVSQIPHTSGPEKDQADVFWIGR